MNLKSIFSETEIIKSSGLIFLANFFGAIVLFISNILISTYFGPENFGNFKIILELSLFLPILIEFGANVTIVKYTAEMIKRDRKKVNYLIKWILKLRLISYSILLIVMFIFKEQIAIYLLKDASLSSLVIPGIFISGLFFFEIFKSISLGSQDYKKYSISKFLTFFSSGILMLIFGYLFGVYFALMGWSLSYFLGNLPLMISSFKKGMFDDSKKFDMKKIFFNFSFPMYIMFFPGLLSSAAIPILSLYYSQKIIGYFSFSMIFFNGISLIPISFADFLFPKISSLSGKKNERIAKESLDKVLILYTLILIPGVIATILLSDFIIQLIAPLYLPSILVFKTLVTIGFLLGYFLIYEHYLRGLARLKEFSIIFLIHNIIFLSISFLILGIIF